MTIEEFIEKISKRPIPEDIFLQVDLLARESAEGVIEGLWESSVLNDTFGYSASSATNLFFGNSRNKNMVKFFSERWNNDNKLVQLMPVVGYVTILTQNARTEVRLTQKAFDLLNQASGTKVFVSYKREASSAFALLAATAMIQKGIDAFVDMQLEPSTQWKVELEQNIRQSDYFVIILNKETLTSDVTIEEIGWALDAEIPIIPIWHYGFKPDEHIPSETPQNIVSLIKDINAIQVTSESALAYNTALVELMNYFGLRWQ